MRKLRWALSLTAMCAFAQAIPPDYEGVLKTLGKQGDFKADVLKVNIPRNDVKVTIDGIATPTPFGFGGWREKEEKQEEEQEKRVRQHASVPPLTYCAACVSKVDKHLARNARAVRSSGLNIRAEV